MEKLYDPRPIPYEESYLSYGIEHIEDMTNTELKNEIKRVEKDIKELAEEAADCKKDKTPNFAMIEEISSLRVYLEKLQTELADREKRNKKNKKEEQS